VCCKFHICNYQHTLLNMEHIIVIPDFVENNNVSLFEKIWTMVDWTKINYFKRHICHYDGSVNEINAMIRMVETQFARHVTGVFLNYYENGNEYAPYHADKYESDTCLISLGATRTLRYKHNTTKINTDYELNNGDLLFIPDMLNNNYKHSLLKRTKLTEKRISILLFLE